MQMRPPVVCRCTLMPLPLPLLPRSHRDPLTPAHSTPTLPPPAPAAAGAPAAGTDSDGVGGPAPLRRLLPVRGPLPGRPRHGHPAGVHLLAPGLDPMRHARMLRALPAPHLRLATRAAGLPAAAALPSAACSRGSGPPTALKAGALPAAAPLPPPPPPPLYACAFVALYAYMPTCPLRALPADLFAH